MIKFHNIYLSIFYTKYIIFFHYIIIQNFTSIYEFYICCKYFKITETPVILSKQNVTMVSKELKLYGLWQLELTVDTMLSKRGKQRSKSSNIDPTLGYQAR